MSGSSTGLTILLCTPDTSVHTQVKQTLKHASLTVVRDFAALQKELPKQRFDAVVLESRSGHEIPEAILDYMDTSRTLFITGSRDVLKKTLKLFQPLTHQPEPRHGKPSDTSLESYLEMKMGDFVRDMRNGSAKDLHPILISAVERPLIASALRETKGNQLQAAELLGLNRNTLRKKIVELRLPLKRTRAKVIRHA